MGVKFAARTANFSDAAMSEIFAFARQPGVISFTNGMPAPETFPIEEMQIAAREVLEAESRSQTRLGLQYGPITGFAPLREWLAVKMQNDGMSFTADEIMLTTGSQQALDLVAKILIDPGDTIALESPGYEGAMTSFKVYQPKFAAFAMDSEGLQTDRLEAALSRGAGIKMLYTIADFQNPMGITMSLARRRKIAELAAKYEFVVLEDNPYGELRYSGEKIPSITSFDPAGYTIYLGSFSKVYAPGVRVGWLATHNRDIFTRLFQAKRSADLHSNSLTQREVYAFVSRYDFDSHLTKIRACYKIRRDEMLAALKEYFPPEASWTQPDGGFFLWVVLPERVDAADVYRAAVEQKVAFVPGKYYFPDGAGRNTLRLNFSFMSPDLIRTGIERLGIAVKSVLQRS